MMADRPYASRVVTGPLGERFEVDLVAGGDGVIATIFRNDEPEFVVRGPAGEAGEQAILEAIRRIIAEGGWEREYRLIG